MKQQDFGVRYRVDSDMQLHRAMKTLRCVRRFANEDSDLCRVVPGLFIGSIGAAKNLEALRREGVTHILNASPIVPCFHRHQFKYKVVSVYDDAQEDISQFFEETNKFISKGRRKGGVLVHCYAGMSRSATFVLAYLIAREKMSLADALQTTKLARPKISPNSGFMSQLMLFSQQLSLESAMWQCTVFSFPAALSMAAASGRLLEFKASSSESVSIVSA